jgi:hypothetical protein
MITIKHHICGLSTCTVLDDLSVMAHCHTLYSIRSGRLMS